MLIYKMLSHPYDYYRVGKKDCAIPNQYSRPQMGYPVRKSNYRRGGYKKRRNYVLKSKNVKIPFNIPISQVKQLSIDSSAAQLPLEPQAATYSRIYSAQLTNIASGSTYINRSTNNIRLKRVMSRWQCTNNASTSRYLRFMMVGLRGSTNSADTTNWTDLALDPSTLTVQGFTGAPSDSFLKLNRDEYTVLYDRTYRISGTGDGVPNVRTIKINKPMNRLVQYAYNTTTLRRGALYFVVTCYEETGTVAGTDTVVCQHVETTYFNDVRS